MHHLALIEVNADELAAHEILRCLDGNVLELKLVIEPLIVARTGGLGLITGTSGHWWETIKDGIKRLTIRTKAIGHQIHEAWKEEGEEQAKSGKEERCRH